MLGFLAPGARRGPLGRLAGASIGLKVVMAATGVLMFLFLLGHLSGNLLLFSGPDALNAYAQWLRDHPVLLWGARIGLLAALVAHMTAAVRLARTSRAARPQPYARKEWREATWASRHMLLTGLLVFAYVVYHLLHFTFHAIDTGAMGLRDAAGRLDVHAMVVAGFRNPAVALSYVAAQVVLGLHLWHGLPSFFQTMGWDHPLVRPMARRGGAALAALVALGYVSIPVAVWTGVVR
jgi:succinate dehydrogenase / fumarate reductase cytochrome b subunit